MEEQPPEVEDEDEDEDVVEEDADRLLDDDEEEDNEGSVQRLCALMSNTLFLGFDAHVKALEHARARRREALAFKSAVEEDVATVDEGAAKKTQDELDGLGVWMPGDVYRGDVNMRTLQKLLGRVDARGFERSAQQLEVCANRASAQMRRSHSGSAPLQFHQAFMKAAARVIYKGEWETERPMIMEKYGWERCNSEVLISTPRRFGKTYSIVRARNHLCASLLKPSLCAQAIFCACLAMSFGAIAAQTKRRKRLPTPARTRRSGDCRLFACAPRQPQAPRAGAR